MKQKIYVETTIPSFYYETRVDADMVARRDWTRQWWDANRNRYDLVTSDAVVRELEDGEYETRELSVRLLEDLERLEIVDVLADIIDVYLSNKLMPRERMGDALHLALASFYKCDFLLTWNCHHIANANKFEHIRIINTRLGLFVPALVTPMSLLSEEDV
ncbi:MAG: type II toxin-antitoxin system VapC family toxin [bacterium]